jgi:hypothetical protein
VCCPLLSCRVSPCFLQVTYFLQHLERKDTLEPLGFEGQLSEEQLRERRAARKALAQPPPKPAGRVIVVGAGAAGLAAATQLQVSGSCQAGMGPLFSLHKRRRHTLSAP